MVFHLSDGWIRKKCCMFGKTFSAVANIFRCLTFAVLH